MSLPGNNSSGDRVDGNGTVPPPGFTTTPSSQRLRLNPNKEHKPDGYEDLELDFSPSIFSSLEMYLPPNMLAVPRDDKAKFMHEILLKYLPLAERTRVCFRFCPNLFLPYLLLSFLRCLILCVCLENRVMEND